MNSHFLNNLINWAIRRDALFANHHITAKIPSQ